MHRGEAPNLELGQPRLQLVYRDGQVRAAEDRRRAGGRVGSAAVKDPLRPIALAGKHATAKTTGAAITSVLEQEEAVRAQGVQR